jgi:hypothetical protein
MSIREILYGALAIAATAIGWHYNLQYLQQPDAGWVDWIRQCLVNPAATSALADLAFVYVIVNVWIVVEAQRLGLRWAWVFVPLTVFVSLAFGLGFFLLFRERRLRALAQAGAPAY